MMNSSERSKDPREFVDSMGVKWRKVLGLPYYAFSEKGDIKSYLSENAGVLLIPSTMENGYQFVNIKVNDTFKKFLVHRLIAIAFIDNPNKLPYVNHKNGIKSDNYADNLEWCDAEYNSRHAVEHDLMKPARGENSVNALMTEDQVRKAYIEFRVNGTPIENLAEGIGVKPNTVRSFIYKNSWCHVTDPIDEQYGWESLSDNRVCITAAQAEEIYLLNKKDNVPLGKLVQMYPQISKKTIEGVIYKWNWKSETDALDAKYNIVHEPSKVTPLDKDLVEKIYLEERLNGTNQREIARMFNVPKSTVYNIVLKYRWSDFTDELDKKYNLPERARKNNAPLDEDTVRECYSLMKSGYTSKQVAQMKGISNDVLRAILHKRSWKKVTDLMD